MHKCRVFCTKFCVPISGPPGAGKSTTAQLLAKDHDFIYYEADAFFLFCNPFIDPKTDNPSMATLSQKPLKVHISSQYWNHCFVRFSCCKVGLDIFREGFKRSFWEVAQCP